MNNTAAMNLWIELVGKYCHCYPDENGNMPCDNGALCDRCMYDEGLHQIYRAKLEENNK